MFKSLEVGVKSNKLFMVMASGRLKKQTRKNN